MGADLRGRNAEAIITGRCYIKLFQNLLGLVRQTFSVLPLTDAPAPRHRLRFWADRQSFRRETAEP